MSDPTNNRFYREPPPTTLAAALVAAHKGQIEAHQHAEEFHYAMGEALEDAVEIDAGADDPYWVEHHKVMLGRAAAALQKMPALWVAAITASVKE